MINNKVFHLFKILKYVDVLIIICYTKILIRQIISSFIKKQFVFFSDNFSLFYGFQFPFS